MILLLASVLFLFCCSSNAQNQIQEVTSSYSYYNYLNDMNGYIARFHPHLPQIPPPPKPSTPPPGLIPNSFANQQVQAEGDNRYILDPAGNPIYIYCQTCGRGK
ncbi:hypothetical protein L596_008143 [Steinernema carpocapsae]|uniref:Uncharacterized protein n=1 Tax=Steinernema carpocapsae TaxID=34508 RepID=A0A4U5PBJ4_STECR|nr:hypothetical protein L596_008143 [Steinernema carpocapsae]